MENSSRLVHEDSFRECRDVKVDFVSKFGVEWSFSRLLDTGKPHRYVIEVKGVRVLETLLSLGTKEKDSLYL